jgi:threonine/homoserine/homoserine lactone efflux protein
MTFETIISFVTAAILLALAPGPDNLFVLTQSALLGRKAGFFIIFGLCTGLVFHSTLVALGVAAIFKTSVIAFSILKYIGACYLLYLAYQLLKAGKQKIKEGEKEVSDHLKLYKKGVILNITNPKVSIFFLAFLPQFTDPAAGSLSLQIFALGGLFILSAFFVFGIIAILAGTIGTWLNESPRAQIIMNRVAAVIFIVLAIKLGAASQ